MKHKTFDQIWNEVNRRKSAGATLRQIARSYETLTFGDIGRILAGHEPKDPRKRTELGLPPLGLAPQCPECGVVHVSSRCPRRKRPSRDLFDIPAKILKWKLENREVITEGVEEDGAKEST